MKKEKEIQAKNNFYFYKFTAAKIFQGYLSLA